uniref:Secreted protein n=1 Tax=Rhizophora mucronata TaxID=61149 RepID=A0A2P2J281_RHIMU
MPWANRGLMILLVEAFGGCHSFLIPCTNAVWSVSFLCLWTREEHFIYNAFKNRQYVCRLLVWKFS